MDSCLPGMTRMSRYHMRKYLEGGPPGVVVAVRPSAGERGWPIREYYRLAEPGAAALKSAVWDTMTTQRPPRLAIK